MSSKANSRQFEYFLYANFDAEKESTNPGNPRRFLGSETDAILSLIAQSSRGTITYYECAGRFGAGTLRKLVDGGILRTDGTSLAFDCPVFLREDAPVLHHETAAKSKRLASLLEDRISEIRACCSLIKNGFSVEINLYHILCGMVFDGGFFDYLCGKGALAVSRQHPSGLDYLNVIYEKCRELSDFSDRLLCSYNRLVNEYCSLQSFGDANGSRFDFFRFFRLMEKGSVPANFKDIAAIFQENYGEDRKSAFLADVVSLIKLGKCTPTTLAVLERFGYMEKGTFCVPIYTPEHQKHIAEIENIVENILGEALPDTLLELSSTIDITAVRHGVNRLEIANELYHILFGSINEELVEAGIVANPLSVSGEGRYFKCIEVF